MDDSNKPSTKAKTAFTTGMVVMLILGLLVGFGITAIVEHSHYNKKLAAATVPTSATKAADLRTTLVTLGIDHMTLTDQAVDAALDGNADATALGTSLYANGNDIGAAVGSVYGASAQKTFDAVWKIHLDQFVDYAVADKEGNTAAMQTALNTIQTQYTIPLSKYLASANPNISESALQTELSDHVAMTATMIDDHVKGNYTAEANELSMANTHIATLFSGLSAAIVKQYPSKF
jgi:sulfur transfer complex TusBCD TusB component (DsrH family)